MIKTHIIFLNSESISKNSSIKLHPKAKNILEKEAYHHLVNVVKASDGDSALALSINNKYNTQGGYFKGHIKLNEKQLEVVDLEWMEFENPLPLVNIYVGCIKSSRLEELVSRCSELGLNKLVIFKAERSQYFFSHNEAEKKYERLKKQAIASIKQSGVKPLPVIEFVSSLNDAVDYLERTRDKKNKNKCSNVVLCTKRTRCRYNIKELLSLYQENLLADEINLFIGPEGDFSEFEYDFLIDQKKFISVHFGETILRTEVISQVLCAIFRFLI